MVNQKLQDRRAAMLNRQPEDVMCAGDPVQDNRDRQEMLTRRIVIQIQIPEVWTDPRLQTVMQNKAVTHSQAVIPLLNLHLQSRHRQNKATGVVVDVVAEDVADLDRKVAVRDRQRTARRSLG